MIITEVVSSGLYTRTHSDTYYIKNEATGEICVNAYEPTPTEWEETDIKLLPESELMAEALGILGVQV